MEVSDEDELAILVATVRALRTDSSTGNRDKGNRRSADHASKRTAAGARELRRRRRASESRRRQGSGGSSEALGTSGREFSHRAGLRAGDGRGTGGGRVRKRLDDLSGATFGGAVQRNYGHRRSAGNAPTTGLGHAEHERAANLTRTFCGRFADRANRDHLSGELLPAHRQ